jgi:hypothetical protein
MKQSYHNEPFRHSFGAIASSFLLAMTTAFYVLTRHHYPFNRLCWSGKMTVGLCSRASLKSIRA